MKKTVIIELEGESDQSPVDRFAELGLPSGPVMVVPFERGVDKAFLVMKTDRHDVDDCVAITDGPGAEADTRHMVAFFHGTDCHLSRWMSAELDRVRLGRHATEFPYCSKREAGGAFFWVDLQDFSVTK